MKHSKGQLKFDAEPVEIKVAPFGLFAYHKGKLVRKEVWKAEDCAINYLNKDDILKKFKSGIAIKSKYKTSGVFGFESDMLAKEHNIRFDFQRFMIELTKLKIKTGFSKDKLIVQTSNLIEDINRMINRFYERLGEWYGLYWPEKVESIKSVDEFAKIVGSKKTGQSMGFDLEEKDLEAIGIAGNELSGLISFREKLSNYLEILMNEVAPNLSKVAGPSLGAKLISIAGKLKKLADMPSSTIQVFGAEKALFRHIRSGAKPPKHGVILSHKLMMQVGPKKRGKLARLLSAKIAIAAKVDYYSKGKDLQWEMLLKDLDKKVSKLK